jgi:L-alanine-DL-glutamate epimerase-like enolase superfamily enzyme
MSKGKIAFTVKLLRIPLRVSFAHASKTREVAESIWIEANRNGHTGCGEGTPRDYVTGETLEQNRQWLDEIIPDIESACESISDLEQISGKYSAAIDKNPSAWCALECAVLDLLSREADCNVEKLLGLAPPYGSYFYSAVLGSSEPAQFEALAKQYATAGFTQYKIKLSGDLQRDRGYLETLETLAQKTGAGPFQVRLDANNFWQANHTTAAAHLDSLARSHSYIAVEEPLTAKAYEAIDELSAKIHKPIILDESLLCLNDLENVRHATGKYIANIKISRVGGILCALKIIDAVKKLGWPIIIGCHVGETSVLTRLALIAARYAGENLIAHEGAFGERVLEEDMVSPCLTMGKGGELKLDMTAADIWEKGLGVTKKSSLKIQR